MGLSVDEAKELAQLEAEVGSGDSTSAPIVAKPVVQTQSKLTPEEQAELDQLQGEVGKPATTFNNSTQLKPVASDVTDTKDISVKAMRGGSASAPPTTLSTEVAGNIPGTLLGTVSQGVKTAGDFASFGVGAAGATGKVIADVGSKILSPSMPDKNTIPNMAQDWNSTLSNLTEFLSPYAQIPGQGIEEVVRALGVNPDPGITGTSGAVGTVMKPLEILLEKSGESGAMGKFLRDNPKVAEQVSKLGASGSAVRNAAFELWKKNNPEAYKEGVNEGQALVNAGLLATHSVGKLGKGIAKTDGLMLDGVKDRVAKVNDPIKPVQEIKPEPVVSPGTPKGVSVVTAKHPENQHIADIIQERIDAAKGNPVEEKKVTNFQKKLETVLNSEEAITDQSSVGFGKRTSIGKKISESLQGKVVKETVDVGKSVEELNQQIQALEELNSKNPNPMLESNIQALKEQVGRVEVSKAEEAPVVPEELKSDGQVLAEQTPNEGIPGEVPPVETPPVVKEAPPIVELPKVEVPSAESIASEIPKIEEVKPEPPTFHEVMDTVDPVKLEELAKRYEEHGMSEEAQVARDRAKSFEEVETPPSDLSNPKLTEDVPELQDPVAKAGHDKFLAEVDSFEKEVPGIKTIPQLGEWLQKSGDKIAEAIGKKLVEVFGKGGKKNEVVVRGSNRNPEKGGGNYNLTGDVHSITFDPNYRTDYNNLTSRSPLNSAVHEGAHALTGEAVLRTEREIQGRGIDTTNPKHVAYGNLKKLMQDVDKWVKDNKVGTLTFDSRYPFSNVHEFIAHAFENREFQEILKQVKIKSGGKVTTALTKLVKLVKKLTGFEGIDDNALQAVLTNADSFMERDVKSKKIKSEEEIVPVPEVEAKASGIKTKEDLRRALTETRKSVKKSNVLNEKPEVRDDLLLNDPIEYGGGEVDALLNDHLRIDNEGWGDLVDPFSDVELESLSLGDFEVEDKPTFQEPSRIKEYTELVKLVTIGRDTIRTSEKLGMDVASLKEWLKGNEERLKELNPGEYEIFNPESGILQRDRAPITSGPFRAKKGEKPSYVNKVPVPVWWDKLGWSLRGADKWGSSPLGKMSRALDNKMQALKYYGLGDLLHKWKDAKANAQWELQTEVKWAEGKLKEFKQEELNNLDLWAVMQQEGGKERLESMGVDLSGVKIPEANMLKFYGELRNKFEGFLDRQNYVRGNIGLAPIGRKANYTFWALNIAEAMRNGTWEATSLMDPSKAILDSKDLHINNPTAKRRSKKGEVPIQVSVTRAYIDYLHATVEPLHVAPIAALAKTLANDPIRYSELLKERPKSKGVRLGQRGRKEGIANEVGTLLNDWANELTGQDALSQAFKGKHPEIAKGMQTIHRNLVTYWINANLGTILKQGTVINGAFAQTGFINTALGVMDMMAGRTFSDKKRGVLATDEALAISMADVNLEKLHEDIVLGKVGGVGKVLHEYGSAPISFTDKLTRQAVLFAGYRHGRSLGLEGMELKKHAQELVISSQGLGVRGAGSPLQSAGVVGQMITTLGSFAISNYNFMVQDVVGIKGEKIGGAKRTAKIMRYAIGAAILSNLYKRVGIDNTFPAPVDAWNEEMEGEGGTGSKSVAAGKAMLELLSIVPVIGSIQYGGLGGPVGQFLGSTIKDAATASPGGTALGLGAVGVPEPYATPAKLSAAAIGFFSIMADDEMSEGQKYKAKLALYNLYAQAYGLPAGRQIYKMIRAKSSGSGNWWDIVTGKVNQEKNRKFSLEALSSDSSPGLEGLEGL
jgi:hypothetical protein